MAAGRANYSPPNRSPAVLRGEKEGISGISGILGYWVAWGGG